MRWYNYFLLVVLRLPNLWCLYLVSARAQVFSVFSNAESESYAAVQLPTRWRRQRVPSRDAYVVAAEVLMSSLTVYRYIQVHS